jgi:hypothetical protein
MSDISFKNLTKNLNHTDRYYINICDYVIEICDYFLWLAIENQH